MSLTTVGGLAASRILARRHRWEGENRRVAICVDYDDTRVAAIRAGISFEEMLAQVAAHGATHLALPELNLSRLRKLGRLTPRVPPHCAADSPTTGGTMPGTSGVTEPRQASVGHWNYLHGEPALVEHLASELNERLPYTEAQVLAEQTLVLAGDLPTIGAIGLGFEKCVAQQISDHGLGIVPRPVSYAWPERTLLERTLQQAAALGNLVAFEGDMILGHEMHLDETLDAMTHEGLSFVYFAESHHQKGDWFIAKQRAPHVVLGHQFTREEMLEIDLHAACHNWVHLVRERGIRFCYVNFFHVLHATESLEGLQYLEHLKGA